MEQEDVQGLREAFDSRWVQQPVMNDLTGTRCWQWIGKNGAPSVSYGSLYFGRKAFAAHRLAWALYRSSPLPPFTPGGLMIDHLCCHKWCVNPWHLDLVSHAENSRRGKLQIFLGRERRWYAKLAKAHERMKEQTTDRKTLKPLLYTTDDVAYMAGVDRGTVIRWRREGKGPPFLKIGRLVRYECGAVQAWIAAQKEVDA